MLLYTIIHIVQMYTMKQMYSYKFSWLGDLQHGKQTRENEQ